MKRAGHVSCFLGVGLFLVLVRLTGAQEKSCDWDGVKSDIVLGVAVEAVPVEVCRNGTLARFDCRLIYKTSREDKSARGPKMDLISLTDGSALVFVDDKLQYYGSEPHRFTYKKGMSNYKFELEEQNYLTVPFWRFKRENIDGTSDVLEARFPPAENIRDCASAPSPAEAMAGYSDSVPSKGVTAIDFTRPPRTEPEGTLRLGTIIRLPRTSDRTYVPDPNAGEACDWNGIKSSTRVEDLQNPYVPVDICIDGKRRSYDCAKTFNFGHTSEERESPTQLPDLDLVVLKDGSVLVYLDSKLQYYGTKPADLVYMKGKFTYRFRLTRGSCERDCWKLMLENSSWGAVVDLPPEEMMSVCAG